MSAASPSSIDRTLMLARVLLFAQIIAVAAWLTSSGRLRPELVNDSAGYIDYPWTSLEAALSSMRTPGFPALVKLADIFAADHREVPILVFALFSIATILFFESLRTTTGGVLVSLWSASALLYSNILHGYVQTIATDTLAAAAGIASCAAVLFWIRRPRWWMYAAVSLAVTMAWLVRPANLFLCGFVPVAAWICRGITTADSNGRRFWKIVALGVATCLPPALYATLRCQVTGQWGIVSFGGYNAVGITGQLITPDLIGRFPEQDRPIIRGALERREARPKSDETLDSEPRLHYLRMERHYDQTIWDEFAPSATDSLGDSPVKINAALGRIASEAIKFRAGEYAIWLAKATRQGVKKLFWDNADNPVNLGVLLATALAFLVRVSQSLVRGTQVVCLNESDRLAILVVASSAILYAGMNLAVVVPVCPPLGRMTDAAGVLLPSALFGLFGPLVIRGKQGRAV